MFKQTLFFAILATAQAQLVSNGQCDFRKLVYQHDSNSPNLSNLYEIRRINNNWNAGHCASWQFTTRNYSLFMTSKEVTNRKLIQRNTTTSSNSDGSLKATFTGLASNFTFLGTSKDYVVLYACTNQKQNKQEYAWVLGRKNTLSKSSRTATDNILQNNNLYLANWLDISHTRQSCRTNGGNNLKLSPMIVLIVGFLVSKGL